MSKKDRQSRLRTSLSDALLPRTTPSPKLDEILSRFAPAQPQINPGGRNPHEIKPTTTVDATVTTTVDAAVDNAEESTAEQPPAERPAQPQYLDATHTASEQKVYSVMYRETISKGMRERHYGPKELCAKTGIRSDRTVRVALWGLLDKLSIEIVKNKTTSPLGPRYRVNDPKEITKLRKAAGIEIDPQSKKIATTVDATVATTVTARGKNYSSRGAKSTGATTVEITAASSKYINEDLESSPPGFSSSTNGSARAEDDDAMRGLIASLRTAERELTGRESQSTEQWDALGKLLVTELRIAAARTTVSSVPAFLTEHLRRRLWKKETPQLIQQSLPEESRERESALDVSKCLDCGGSGLYYPDGYEKGVAKCRHVNLPRPERAEAS